MKRQPGQRPASRSHPRGSSPRWPPGEALSKSRHHVIGSKMGQEPYALRTEHLRTGCAHPFVVYWASGLLTRPTSGTGQKAQTLRHSNSILATKSVVVVRWAPTRKPYGRWWTRRDDAPQRLSLGQARRRRLCATQTRFWLRNQSSWFGGRQLASRTAGGGLDETMPLRNDTVKKPLTCAHRRYCRSRRGRRRKS